MRKWVIKLPHKDALLEIWEYIDGDIPDVLLLS